VSVNPAANPGFLTRSTRPFAITLLFLFIGPLIEIALSAISLVCYLALLGGLDAVYAIQWMIHFNMIRVAPGLLTWRLLMPLLVSYAARAGFVGLIVGICDMLFGRLSVWLMLALSIATGMVWRAWVLLATWNLIPRFDSTADVLRMRIAPEVIVSLCFIASMMLCWEMIEIVRGKTPAVKGLPPA